jgi:tetratricopeptide (TPR) repeat protein
MRADYIASALAKSGTSTHAFHTLVKSAIATVKDASHAAEKSDDELTQEAFGQAVRTAEERLRSGLQRFPNDPYLLTEEAALSGILRNADRALKALDKAFEKNPRSELIARRYARVLIAKERTSEAIKVLRRRLEHNQGSYSLNYDIAQAIRKSAPDADTTQSDSLLFHFQRAFSKGDKNYEAHFWYARQLCLVGRQAIARPIFESLKKISVSYAQKRSPRGTLLSANSKP